MRSPCDAIEHQREAAINNGAGREPGAAEAGIRVCRLRTLGGLGPLRAEAAAEGFGFLDRLSRDWEAGANRFDRPGERLLGAIAAETLVAVAGLNRDPFTRRGAVGRLRRFYVARSCRRAGVGGALARDLIDHARGVFDELRLRTDSHEAGAFYERLGFSPIDDPDATHRLVLR